MTDFNYHNKQKKGGFVEEVKEVKKFEVSGKISTTHFEKDHLVRIMKGLGFKDVCVEEKVDPRKNSKRRRKS